MRGGEEGGRQGGGGSGDEDSGWPEAKGVPNRTGNRKRESRRYERAGRCCQAWQRWVLSSQRTTAAAGLERRTKRWTHTQIRRSAPTHKPRSVDGAVERAHRSTHQPQALLTRDEARAVRRQPLTKSSPPRPPPRRAAEARAGWAETVPPVSLAPMPAGPPRAAVWSARCPIDGVLWRKTGKQDGSQSRVAKSICRCGQVW